MIHGIYFDMIINREYCTQKKNAHGIYSEFRRPYK